MFVYAVGRLNNWKTPEIPGIENYQGDIVHTAHWPSGLDVHNKNVAVIGNGASAVQCLAKIYPGQSLSHMAHNYHFYLY